MSFRQSYLNLNGLKSPLEKGTCKIESDYKLEAGKESNIYPSAITTIYIQDMQIFDGSFLPNQKQNIILYNSGKMF